MTSASSSATPSVLHPKYRPDIDGLRALAVLSVVGFHAFPGWVRGGFIGVDVFFVISGFLISTIILQSLQKGSFSFKDFYVRRVRRIFPALVVVLIVTYSFGWFALLADEYKQFGKHVVAGAGFVSNFALWRESGYFDNAAETKPLLHLWSLGIEEQFYILWPLILWLGWKLRVNLLVWIVLIAIASFALNLRAVGHDAVAAFYSPQTRFWELLSGAGLAWVALNRKWEASGPVSDTLSVFGTLVLAVGFWKISRSSSFPGVWALFPVFGAVLIISAGPQGWLNRQVYSNRVAVWFGLISFPLYLWHWPIFSFLRIIQGQGPAIGVRVVGVLLSVALAWLTYRFLERPLRFGRYRNLSVSFLIAPMMAIAALGYQAYARDGFQGRASVRGFVNNKNELLRISALDSECLSYVGIEKPLFPYCRFSQAGGTETVAVIGDSHAHVAY
ncbi:acyltransferase, partial [bacterium]|nr:acyltransferase [bacterium]